MTGPEDAALSFREAWCRWREVREGWSGGTGATAVSGVAVAEERAVEGVEAMSCGRGVEWRLGEGNGLIRPGSGGEGWWEDLQEDYGVCSCK